MNKRKAEGLTNYLMYKHKLPYDWKFRWQNKKNSLGTCSYHRKLILLSKWYVELNDIEEVKDTILHEIAHALAYVRYGKLGIGHGHLWKRVCVEIGAIPKSCSKNNLNKPKDHYKYNDVCQCGINYRMHRLRRNCRYSCPKCHDPLFVSKSEKAQIQSAKKVASEIFSS